MTDADLTEQLRSVAAQVLTADKLGAFMAVADAKRCADDSGEIEADKVVGHLRTEFGISDTQPTHDWCQSSGQAPGALAGDDGRASLEKRHGVKNQSPNPIVNRDGMDRARTKRQPPPRTLTAGAGAAAGAGLSSLGGFVQGLFSPYGKVAVDIANVPSNSRCRTVLAGARRRMLRAPRITRPSSRTRPPTCTPPTTAASTGTTLMM